MNVRRCRHRSRLGLTLVELLMVIAVATLLLGASVPLLRVGLQSQREREGARILNAAIVRAKSRAAEIGRPVSIILRRADPALPEGPNYCERIMFAEAPPPYMGDLYYVGDGSGSEARIIPAVTPGTGLARITNCQSLRQQGNVVKIVMPGDLIQFNFRLPKFEIVSISDDPNSGDVFVEFKHPYGQGITLPVNGPWIPFQIYLTPGGNRNVLGLHESVQMPTGIAIDLTFSGVGVRSTSFAPAFAGDNLDVVIQFEPDGTVSRVYDSAVIGGVPASVGSIPESNIYLCVGRVEEVVPGSPFANTKDLRSNLMDMDSLWVVISPNTGKVTTADNSPEVINAVNTLPAPVTVADVLPYAREFALASQDKGGR